MNNDLISREALKKALKSNCDLCLDKNTNWCEHCCPLNDFEDLIDNAPTVEAVSLEHHNKIKGFLDNEIKSLVEILDKERPQGEWITKNLEKPYGRCNQCGEICEVDNYCGNCGAKMQKGGAE